MKAFQLIAHGQPGNFQLNEVPRPVPQPDEALVAVKACGLNHIDLWLEEAGLPIPAQLPRTPGGEIAGIVAETGTAVRDWQPGDRVAIQSNLFCGECEFCRRGEESICLKGQLLGVDCDGGFAEFTVIKAATLVRLPAGVDFQASAALTLAGSTALHMLTDRACVRPGDWVLAMGGASGVGSAAIQIAKHLGARVVSTGRTEAKRELARQLGAEAVVNTDAPDWPAEVRRLTGKRGVDLVIEHIGGTVLEQSFNCLARGGAVVTCGATTGKDVRLNLWPLFVKQQRLIGSYGRNRADMAETLRWAERGWLKPVIDSEFKLGDADKAFARLRTQGQLGKILVTA
ncbi:MAG: zinc-binding dehydrogenase [Verrucomicrobia bacterium]|nr:zinc-binding dehydrogenase [Verrucomicrobiota bacterium]